MTITVELGAAPAKPMSINDERSVHWREVRAHSRAWRQLAWVVAKNGHLAAVVAGAPATVTVEIPVKGNHRRDPANYFGVSKAIIDGLVDAGVWSDDTADYVTVAEPILVVGGDSARIHLDLREAPLNNGVREHLRAAHGMGNVDLYGLDETAIDNTHRYEHSTRQRFLTHDHDPPWQQPVLFDQDAPA